MNKSQLRKLAREFALGKLEEDEYRRQRRDLLRDIADGSVAIVREAPPPPPPKPDPAESTAETALEIEPERSKLSPLYIGIGLAIVAALVWFFLPSPEPTEETATVEQSVPVPRIPPARSLVGEFVAKKDWSEFSISRFKENWNKLSDAERRDAVTSRWFNELTNAISKEIKTQNALLGFDSSGNAARTGERLAALAAFLGVEENVTELKGADAPRPPDVQQQSAAVEAAEPESIARSTAASEAARPEPAAGSTSAGEPAAEPAAATETRVSSRKTLRTVSGTKWLDDQPAGSFTLQLFAVNHLEKIQQLIASNPGVDLQVLVSAHSEPRYRVIHGAFETAETALAAHAALPESIRRAQPAPLVKSIGDLRKDIDNGDWIGAVDAKKYTLQLFATDDSDNARLLISKYPALKLSLLDTGEVRSRYRVLYGTFDSEGSAKAAVSELPRQLVRDAGSPLVKTVGELQAARR